MNHNNLENKRNNRDILIEYWTIFLKYKILVLTGLVLALILGVITVLVKEPIYTYTTNIQLGYYNDNRDRLGEPELIVSRNGVENELEYNYIPNVVYEMSNQIQDSDFLKTTRIASGNNSSIISIQTNGTNNNSSIISIQTNGTKEQQPLISQLHQNLFNEVLMEQEEYVKQQKTIAQNNYREFINESVSFSSRLMDRNKDIETIHTDESMGSVINMLPFAFSVLERRFLEMHNNYNLRMTYVLGKPAINSKRVTLENRSIILASLIIGILISTITFLFIILHSNWKSYRNED